MTNERQVDLEIIAGQGREGLMPRGKRRLPRIAALVPFLPQATCRFWLCWTGSSNRCRTSAIGRPICRRNRAGAMVVNDQSRYTLNRHVSECVLDMAQRDRTGWLGM
jgi:hypothetical protein